MDLAFLMQVNQAAFGLDNYFPATHTKRKAGKINYRKLVFSARFFAFVGILLLLLPVMTTKIAESIAASSQAAVNQISSTAQMAGDKQIKQPPVDPSLPVEPRVRIARIGLDAQIRQLPQERYEEALEAGAWMPLDFGTPASDGPTIVAAHRFGYLKWTNEFRRKNSFFNLPKLAEGDRVEVIWHQRKYEYEVYKTENGTEITDYDADLILFTCNDLVSDMRIVVYAKQI